MTPTARDEPYRDPPPRPTYGVRPHDPRYVPAEPPRAYLAGGPPNRVVTALGDRGEVTGVACPRCGRRVLYSGNYRCERWTYRGRPPGPFAAGACDWALSYDDAAPDGLATAEDRAVWAELRATYPRLRDYLAQHPEEDDL